MMEQIQIQEGQIQGSQTLEIQPKKNYLKTILYVIILLVSFPISFVEGLLSVEINGMEFLAEVSGRITAHYLITAFLALLVWLLSKQKISFLMLFSVLSIVIISLLCMKAFGTKLIAVYDDEEKLVTTSFYDVMSVDVPEDFIKTVDGEVTTYSSRNDHLGISIFRVELTSDLRFEDFTQLYYDTYKDRLEVENIESLKDITIDQMVAKHINCQLNIEGEILNSEIILIEKQGYVYLYNCLTSNDATDHELELMDIVQESIDF